MQVMLVYLLYYLGILFLFPTFADVFCVPLFTKSKQVSMIKRLENIRKKKTGIMIKIMLVIMRIVTHNSKNLYRFLR
jgi:hypothetical protein